MTAPILRGPPPDTLTRLLSHTEFASAAQIIGNLSAAQALSRLPNAPHSIAEIVAHMLHNMQFNLDLIEGRPASREDAWPRPIESQWTALVQTFLDVNQVLIAAAQDPELLGRVVYQASDTEPAWTVGYKLAVNVGLHNAYHFGQIVVLRQLLGAWPEPTERS